MASVSEKLARSMADPGLIRYARNYSDLESLWADCPRAEWLLWMLRRYDRSSRPQLRAFACLCARRFWSRFSDARSRNAVSIAERFAQGEAMSMELQVARDGAKAAAEDLTREGDLVAARFAWLAHATTLERPIDAACECFNRAFENSKLSVGLLGDASGEHKMASHYADQLRLIIGNPLKVQPIVPVKPVSRESRPATNASTGY